MEHRQPITSLDQWATSSDINFRTKQEHSPPMHMLFLAVKEASDFPLWHRDFFKFHERMFIGL